LKEGCITVTNLETSLNEPNYDVSQENNNVTLKIIVSLYDFFPATCKLKFC
jgi:hypothetical protein